jgi:transposase
MDTNGVEREIRPIALTRKNALFAGNDGGARHWAIAMTLIQIAKLNGVEPMAYLTDVLEQVVSGRTKTSAREALLPWNWKASHSSATAAAQAA